MYAVPQRVPRRSGERENGTLPCHFRAESGKGSVTYVGGALYFRE